MYSINDINESIRNSLLVKEFNLSDKDIEFLLKKLNVITNSSTGVRFLSLGGEMLNKFINGLTIYAFSTYIKDSDLNSLLHNNIVSGAFIYYYMSRYYYSNKIILIKFDKEEEYVNFGVVLNTSYSLKINDLETIYYLNTLQGIFDTGRSKTQSYDVNVFHREGDLKLELQDTFVVSILDKDIILFERI